MVGCGDAVTDTPDDIFDDLADRLATARMRYLTGDPDEARRMLQQVRGDYLRHRAALRGVAGVLALRDGIEGAGKAMGI